MSDEELVQFILGDSRPYTVEPKINKSTFTIDPTTSEVKAAIVSTDKKKMLTPSYITLSSTTQGSDWSISKLIVKFPKDYTKDITIVGKALLELQVTFKSSVEGIEDDDWTWFFPIELVRGNIL